MDREITFRVRHIVLSFVLIVGLVLLLTPLPTGAEQQDSNSGPWVLKVREYNATEPNSMAWHAYLLNKETGQLYKVFKEKMTLVQEDAKKK